MTPPENTSPRTLHFTSRSPEDTHRLGRLTGEAIDKPLIIAFTGDLGSGKTAFIKGLAEGLDVPPTFYITSPTFTIINDYPGRFRLFHVDLYRVADPMELEEIGFEEILGGAGVVAIEWAERLEDEDIDFQMNVSIDTTGPEERKFTIFFYGPDDANLVDAIKKNF